MEQKERQGWREVKLGEIAFFKTGKLNSNAEKLKGVYPFFTCSPETLKIDDYAFDEEALILAGNNANGIFSLKYYKGKFNAYQRTYVINVNRKHIEYKFLFYALKRQLADLITISHGTATKYLTLPILHNIKIALPLLSEQKAIAEVLSSLDDKIDLLHRQNKTLEDMAQALFRKWFVEDADEGWEEKPLDKVANYLNGLACQKYPPRNETDRLPVLKIKDLRNGIDENSDWVASEVKGEYIVNRGDIIFSWSGSLMIKLWDGVKCVLNQHLFKVSSTRYPKWYIYLWTKHHIDKFVQIAESKATTMGHIKRGDLSNSMALVPTSEQLSEMDNAVSPLLESVIHNFKKTNTLKNFRDTLLSKLISGETRVLYG